MNSNRIIYDTVGTLGDTSDDLTCSIVATKRWNKAQHIKAYSQFELAAKDLKNENISSMVVPGAYPQIGTFIMDNEIEVSEVFIDKIPPLVLAGKYTELPKTVEIIFHHPATTTLLKELGLNFHESSTVLSNARACISLEKSTKSAIAITNKLCADYYMLHTYIILRVGINMPFVCFTKKQV